MPNTFATISFTQSVKAAQTRYGSRENNRGFELQDDPRNELGNLEIEYIAARDSFYMATISENDWPYVQHRGGPAGFLRVLDSRTIGFADFSGNRQYLSVGNLNANARVSLILMDYPNRRRLKIWGTTRIVHEADEPELIARLVVSGYRARVERGMVIQVEAIDWNCPQHITPRYSETEVDHVMQPLLDENKKLRDQVMQNNSSSAYDVINEPLGSGSLAVVVSGIRQLTPRIRSYELRHPSGKQLPVVSAGSHLSIPVLMPDGSPSTRNYSISSNPAQQDSYEIAVLLDAEGKGGSRFVHEHFQLGTQLNCGLPHNHFELHEDNRSAVLIAGGIGITPIKAMASALKNEGRDFHIHYVGRSKHDMAFIDNLQREFSEKFDIYTSEQHGLDLVNLMANVSDESVFYVCGPQRLIAGVQQAAAKLGIAETRIRFERFYSPVISNAQSFEVELRRSGKTVTVPHDVSILSAVEAAGIRTMSNCKVGNCGTCAVKVLEGTPLHCDAVLTEREHTQGKLMCICVSRANSAKLVLDL
jgi:ferredoxin-NADP reductase/predicted pyridoxine 5'-phosphate oxidase superfamily flavin-nucleotide-binding protein